MVGTGFVGLFLLGQVTRGLKAEMGGGWVVSIPEGCSGFSSGLGAVR